MNEANPSDIPSTTFASPTATTGDTLSQTSREPGTYLPERDCVGIGIDLGMTYSGAAVYYETYTGSRFFEHIPLDGFTEEHKFPTLVYVLQGALEDSVVGKTAADRLTTSNPGKLYSLFKRYLGTEWRTTETGNEVTATVLSRLVLKKIRKNVELYLQQQGLDSLPVRYTFTYPGMWSEVKQRALQTAIADAGFGTFRVLEEPVAAAVGAAQLEGKFTILRPNQKVLICDLGGGTLDLSLITPTHTEAIKVKAAPGGDPDVGMSNLDKILALHVMRQQGLLATSETEEVDAVLSQAIVFGDRLESAWAVAQKLVNDSAWCSALLLRCEDLKRSICDLWNQQDSWRLRLPNGVGLTVSKDEVRPYFQAMNDAVKSAAIRYLDDLQTSLQISPEDVTFVIASGGGSRLPGIREALASLLQKAVVQQIKETEARSLVQRGAAYCAYRPETVLERRCNSSYGVYTWSSVPPKYPKYFERGERKRHGDRVVTLYPVYEKFLHRHDPIPVSPIKRMLQPLEDGLKEITIPILQGEDEDPTSPMNQRVGVVSMPQRRQSTYRDVIILEFFLGDDGLMHAQGRDSDGQVTEVVKWSTD